MVWYCLVSYTPLLAVTGKERVTYCQHTLYCIGRWVLLGVWCNPSYTEEYLLAAVL